LATRNYFLGLIMNVKFEHFADTGAWVQFETVFPSGYHVVTLYDTGDNVFKRRTCDSLEDAMDYRNSFINMADKWGSL